MSRLLGHIVVIVVMRRDVCVMCILYMTVMTFWTDSKCILVIEEDNISI